MVTNYDFYTFVHEWYISTRQLENIRYVKVIK